MERVLVPEEFARAVHDLLTHLYDPVYVQTHPLARVACRNSEATSKSAGQVLSRDVLVAIESLRPSGEDANGRKGRGFQILTWRYVDGLSIEEIRERLAISHSTYYREYQRGVQAIVSVLRTRWGVADSLTNEPGRVQLIRSDHGKANSSAGMLFQASMGVPSHLTQLIGRERELADVTRLLSTTRLVTLTGTGGCGKTRLAWQLAEDLAGTYPDGVGVVELGALADPDLVAESVAMALGLKFSREQMPTDVLMGHLRSQQFLLVLDNCEHLIEACVQLVDRLVTVCPRLTVLTTSRQVLGMTGEIGWRVPSLGTPNPKDLLRAGDDPVATALAYPAVQLFVERARAALPEFSLDVHNVDAIVRICRRLDGIPLALELAAALVAGIAPGQIARRLDDRFQLLTFGDPSELPRQRTLLATLDWSYSLLSEDERTLFRRLAVFGGHFSLEAVEEVCGADPLPRAKVLTCLVKLVEKSLVVMLSVRDEARYRLLETIREYGLGKLTESGEADAIHHGHADYYFTLATATPREPTGFDRLEQDHNNLRAALRWFLARGDAERAQRLGAALWAFWAIRGYLTEGRQQLATLLALPESTAPLEVRAEILAGAGRLAFNQSDLPAARPFFEQSLACWRAAGEMANVSQLLLALGNLYREQGEVATARAHFEEGLAVARAIDSRRDIASALSYRGLLALQEGEFAEAEAFLNACLGIQRDLKDEWGLVWSASRLGHVAHARGDLVTARRLYSESLDTLRRWKDKRGTANLLANLGMVDVDEGDYSRATTHLRESAKVLQELRDGAGTAVLLDAWAGLAAAQARAARALRLAGAAAALRRTTGAGHPRNLADWLERALTPARRRLDEEVALATWSEGQAMTLDQAIDYALGSDQPMLTRESSASDLDST